MDFSQLSTDRLESRIAEYEEWDWDELAADARSELRKKEEEDSDDSTDDSPTPNKRVRPTTDKMDDLSDEELRDRIEEYEEWGWETLIQEAESELSSRGEGEEGLSYEERLSEANLSASEELRCKSVSLPHE